MKIMIDQSGALYIERAGRLSEQKCPFDPAGPMTHGSAACGHWCPLFEEPIKRQRFKDVPNDAKGGFGIDTVELRLCKKNLEVEADDFEDLRGTAKD